MKFKTSLPLSGVLALLAGIFVYLGVWQLQRAEEKRSAQQRFDNASEVTELTGQLPEWTRVRLTGDLDRDRHLLLDNKLLNGKAGVHVLTPFKVARTDHWILINRGWLALPADRSSLPPVPTPEHRVQVSGRLAQISIPGVQIGQPVDLQQMDWPQLMVYPEWERMEAAYGHPLHRQVLYLDPDSGLGFEDRLWTPFTMGPDRHKAYAVQWFGLCITALVIWLVLGFSAGRRIAR